MHCVKSSCPYVALLHIVWTLAIVSVAQRSMRAESSVSGGMCSFGSDPIGVLMPLFAWYMRHGMAYWGPRALTAYVRQCFLFLSSVDPFATAADPSNGIFRKVVGSSRCPWNCVPASTAGPSRDLAMISNVCLESETWMTDPSAKALFKRSNS